MNFPLGGKALWDMRVAGQAPEDMVVASLAGPQGVQNPVMWVGDTLSDSALRGLEWRMVAGLDVEVVATGATPLPRLLAVLRAILPHARDVFVRYPDAGFRLAVRWLDPQLPIRLVDFEGEATPEDRALAGAVVRRLRSELVPSRHS